MRVPFNDNMGRWSRNIRAIDWSIAFERLLLVLVAVQCARLIWAIVTPVGSFGAWEGRQAQILSPSARQALFASFDPFFPAGGPPQAGSVVVTSLALTLYGIRLNEGSGLGSAIIAGPDGVQNSFAVGDEIMPGVVLKAVAFDHVTIDRGGAEEQVFIDQSEPAPTGTPADGAPLAAPSPAPAAPGGTPTAESLKRDIGFTPRLQNGRVNGLILTEKGPGFQQAGFKAGDIVTQVNGRPVGSAGDLQTLQNQIAPGGRIALAVERGASTASINLILQGP